MKFRQWFDRERLPAKLYGESKTHQSHAEACDVNKIIRKYERTGELPPGRMEPQYADVTSLQNADFGTLLQKSRETLDTAGRELEKQQLEKVKNEKQEIQKMKQELDELRKKVPKEPTPPAE